MKTYLRYEEIWRQKRLRENKEIVWGCIREINKKEEQGKSIGIWERKKKQ